MNNVLLRKYSVRLPNSPNLPSQFFSVLLATNMGAGMSTVVACGSYLILITSQISINYSQVQNGNSMGSRVSQSTCSNQFYMVKYIGDSYIEDLALSIEMDLLSSIFMNL